jgi:hypothetical protein
VKVAALTCIDGARGAVAALLPQIERRQEPRPRRPRSARPKSGEIGIRSAAVYTEISGNQKTCMIGRPSLGLRRR